MEKPVFLNNIQQKQVLKIIMPFLPYKAKEFFVNNEQIFYIVFVLIWITGLAGTIITPAINLVSKGILSLGKLIFRL